MARKANKKVWQETKGDATATRPRRNAVRRSVKTYCEDSDSDLEEKREPSEFVKAEKKKDDDTVETKVSSSSEEEDDEEIVEPEDERPAKTKLASKKSPKASTGPAKKKVSRKKVNETTKGANKKRKRAEIDDIDESRYTVSPPKKSSQSDDNPVDWRVLAAVDY